MLSPSIYSCFFMINKVYFYTLYFEYPSYQTRFHIPLNKFGSIEKKARMHYCTTIVCSSMGIMKLTYTYCFRYDIFLQSHYIDLILIRNNQKSLSSYLNYNNSNEFTNDSTFTTIFFIT